MKSTIVAFSDTHGLHAEIESSIPECDILIHAGDAMMYGESKMELSDFLDWFSVSKATVKIYVPGNHDGIVESNKEDCKLLCKKAGVNLLVGETLEVGGLKIYGYPWTNRFMDWSFMLQRDEMEVMAKKIPKDVDIVVSHGPLFGYLDSVALGSPNLGSKELFYTIEKIQPKYFICGHIHGSYGNDVLGKTKIYNCSICDESYNPVNDFTKLSGKAYDFSRRMKANKLDN